ncbi:MAG: hypothetical protein M0Q41_01575 [Bacteroidales bacterium]|nr:hypothetical protein [Bacteroidales bacterium]
MNRLLKRTFFVLGIAVILILLVHYVRIPYYIHSRGIVMPVQEWILKKDTKGALVSVFKNNLINSTTQFTITEFERGDLAQFQLKDKLFDSDKIGLGDTVGLIRSTEEEKRYVELMAELEVQQSLLKVYTSGEKPESVRMAYESLLRAEQEYSTQKLLTQRHEGLYQKGYIPAEEYELSYTEMIVKQQNVNVAKANYESLITGAKQEEVDYIRASIHALELQVEQADRRLSFFHITSPLTGQIVGKRNIMDEEDIVLNVADRSQLLFVMPIAIDKLPYISNGHDLIVKSNIFGTSYTARIVFIDNSVQIVGQRQNVFVTAALTENQEEVLTGMMLDATISTGWITIPEYFRRLFRIVVAN